MEAPGQFWGPSSGRLSDPVPGYELPAPPSWPWLRPSPSVQSPPSTPFEGTRRVGARLPAPGRAFDAPSCATQAGGSDSSSSSSRRSAGGRPAERILVRPQQPLGTSSLPPASPRASAEDVSRSGRGPAQARARRGRAWAGQSLTPDGTRPAELARELPSLAARCRARARARTPRPDPRARREPAAGPPSSGKPPAARALSLGSGDLPQPAHAACLRDTPPRSRRPQVGERGERPDGAAWGCCCDCFPPAGESERRAAQWQTPARTAGAERGEPCNVRCSHGPAPSGHRDREGEGGRLTSSCGHVGTPASSSGRPTSRKAPQPGQGEVAQVSALQTEPIWYGRVRVLSCISYRDGAGPRRPRGQPEACPEGWEQKFL